MKNIWFPALIFIVFFPFISCKQKESKTPEKENFIPALPFIRSQVAQVDTSLYSIKKITYVDSTKSDTVYYKREQFRELASDFLNLPDISGPKYKDQFTEEKQFDETLNRAIFSYQPVNRETAVIQRLQVLVRPDPPNDKITTIIIDYSINNKDSSVQKKMLWQVDKSFQVTTFRQLPGQPETTSIYKVIWNEEDDE